MQRDQYDPENATERESPEESRMSSQAGGSSTTQTMQEKASDVQEQAGAVAEQARERAGQFREKAIEGAEQGRQRAASGLHSAAEQMRSRTGEEEGIRTKAMSTAADTMERSAKYLEEHEASEMWEDIERYIKDHPMQAAAGALVAGLIVGRILR